MNIVVCTAHSDDETGMMGTILKYIEEGHNVIKIVFSGGEKSQPHYQEEIIIKQRVRETLRIGKDIGLRDVVFLNLKDVKIKECFDQECQKKIIDVFNQFKPEKVFIPSALDPHVDHRSVNELMQDILKMINYKDDLYSYEVWNLIEENHPIMYVDISEYFKRKIQIMKEFKSQWHFMYTLIIPMYLRCKKYGFKNKCMYAEKFYKLK
ncbi:MAG: PIG-L family deacetylase [Nanoarchaeota archaeon]|nr:PIG-L family deacetylase [Nanoarchaeota archaeon]